MKRVYHLSHFCVALSKCLILRVFPWAQNFNDVSRFEQSFPKPAGQIKESRGLRVTTKLATSVNFVTKGSGSELQLAPNLLYPDVPRSNWTIRFILHGSLSARSNLMPSRVCLGSVLKLNLET